jgi:hypothetical protein
MSAVGGAAVGAVAKMVGASGAVILHALCTVGENQAQSFPAYRVRLIHSGCGCFPALHHHHDQGK